MATSTDKKLDNQIKKEFRTQMLQKRLREDYIINNWIPNKLNCTKDKVFTVLKDFSKVVPNNKSLPYKNTTPP